MEIIARLRHEAIASEQTTPVDAFACEAEITDDRSGVVLPGEVINSASGAFLRGHGTYFENQELIASVAGVVEKVNQLISVWPIASRYFGEVGDIVVGRVAEVGNKCWKIDVNSQQHALLLLSAVYLPGGAQRRRTYEDQLQMRNFFQENDLISAEVQEVRYDGTVTLHTRSLRYGKLENGQFVCVSPALVKRMKQHMITLGEDLNVDVIIGANGYLWITRSMREDSGFNPMDKQNASLEVMETKAEIWAKKREDHARQPMSIQDRKTIANVHRAILHLDEKYRYITPENILAVYHQLNAL
uniref:Exonuclease putative n=1 Tax=Albugo laibachii Nc14 TaxID=890382 RepID=F0WJU5_9STRA|nr:exonuclease putative [Albugo laibachii Nc14]|eukprot:CCA21547.1 exonuclease putative [Albugo laibachii Nc14]